MAATTDSSTHSSTHSSTRRMSAGWIALWMLQGLLALLFVVGSGGPKLVGEAYAVQIFSEIGLGQWLRYVTGVLEVVGGIGLLVPRLVGAAASGLVLLMVLATGAQLFLLDTGFWFTPVIVGVLAGIVAWSRRSEVRSLVSSRY